MEIPRRLRGTDVGGGGGEVRGRGGGYRVAMFGVVLVAKSNEQTAKSQLQKAGLGSC